jgi:hypothetical protein
MMAATINVLVVVEFFSVIKYSSGKMPENSITAMRTGSNHRSHTALTDDLFRCNGWDGSQDYKPIRDNHANMPVRRCYYSD